MKLATHCFAALFAALTILPSASGIGNGPNYDPSKNMLFPGGSSSEALYSALNNAGEFGVSARSKKKGGKLKRIKDVELAVPGAQGLAHVSSVGAGSLVKTSATRLQEIMNMIPSSDGQSMKVFFR